LFLPPKRYAFYPTGVRSTEGGDQAKMKTGELAQAGTLYLLERNEKGIFSRSITWGTVMLEYKAIFLPK
jgi:hypothetical protein